MTDWEAGFVDLTEEVPLPGGRPRRKTAAERVIRRERADMGAWDTNPRFYRVAGEDREWFPISALALALSRSVATLYSWERKGWFPQASFRSPRVDDIPGHRLYSRTFIEKTIKIAEEEGLFTRSPGGRFYPIETTDFAARIRHLMKETGG